MMHAVMEDSLTCRVVIKQGEGTWRSSAGGYSFLRAELCNYRCDTLTRSERARSSTLTRPKRKMHTRAFADVDGLYIYSIDMQLDIFIPRCKVFRDV